MQILSSGNIFGHLLARIAVLSTTIVLVLMPLTSNGAAWSLKAHVSNADDTTICKFDIPISALTGSYEYLSSLPAICGGTINIDGDLTLDDRKALAATEKFYISHPTAIKPDGISINSNGGSIVTALAIADSLRSPRSPLYSKGVAVLEGSNCLSSCVIVLAAGFSRSPWGAIGIHRPRFVGAEYSLLGYQDLNAAYRGLKDLFRQTFDSYNIHPGIVDEMWQVPSSEIRILNESELTRFGLNKSDAVSEEARLLSLTAKCGDEAPAIEKAFTQQVESRCADASGKMTGNCYIAVLKGHPWRACYEKQFGPVDSLEP